MNYKKFFLIRIITILITLYLLSSEAIPAKNCKTHKILILNSYHEGHQWSDYIMNGIREVFEESDIKYEFSIEYMDTKNNDPHFIFEPLAELYKIKYSQEKFDIIISSDNNALDFLLKYRDRLFPEVPVVFCGYNDFKESILEGHRSITGIPEDYDLPGNVEMIIKLQPYIKHLALVSDVTETGRINLERMKKEVMPKYSRRMDFIELTELNPGELKESLNKLPENTAVFNLSYYRTPDGHSLSIEESITFIVENSHAPLYSCWDHMISHGTLGGMATSGKLQGKKAAAMALRILHGTPIENIPPSSDNAITPIFDYNQLKRFKIPLSSLPKGSIIINKTESFYHKYEKFFWPLIAFISLQTLVIIMLVINIIKRVKAEEEVRKSEKRYRTLVENAPLGIISADKKGKIISVNNKLLKILGSPSETKTMSINIFTHKPLIEAGISGDFLRCLKTGETIICERSYKSKWGKKAYLKYHIRPVINKGNRISGIQGIIEDITEQKKLERELREAQKLEAIGRLAGGIAHDFNNILMSITGYTDLIAIEISPDSKSNFYLKQIIKASCRARDLVKEILTFGRKTRLTRKLVKFNPLAKEALKLIRASYPHIQVKEKIDEEPLIVMSDPTQMHRVVMNLCTNACQSMKDRGGILELNLTGVIIDNKTETLCQKLKEGSYVKLTVKDRGCGIPKEHMEYIFEPYFTTKGTGEGTGLGLAVVHGIVKTFGGEITVESEEGKGSIFSIYLPRVECELPEERETESPPLQKGKERILFVDDEEDLIYLAKMRLEKFGYKVMTKNSSTDALNTFQTDPYKFDVVVTDQTMPSMTGSDLARRILAIRPDIPIILCTGFSDTINPEKAREIGIKKFIMKPFDVEDIANSIRSMLV